MSAKPAEPARFPITSFRAKLMVAVMLVVSGITALALYFAQRNVAENVEQDLQREFESELAARSARAETEAIGRYRDQFEELDRLRSSTNAAVSAARAEADELRRQTELEDERRRSAIASELGDYEPKLRELHDGRERMAAEMRELSTRLAENYKASIDRFFLHHIDA